MHIDKMHIEKDFLLMMAVDEMTTEIMSLDEGGGQNVCRQNVCRQIACSQNVCKQTFYT